MATHRIRQGIAPPNWGPFGNPREAARLARAAEAAGWDGYFTWDALPVGSEPPAAHDPWVILAAAATVTESIRIGTCVAVAPRYPPHLMARAVASLDVLSDGRMILGVGLGDGGASFAAFGEPSTVRDRAARLDEALEVITRLWTGETVDHRGHHYTIDGFSLGTLPVQQPRVPIWVGGDSGGAMRRAARWDGWIGPDDDPFGSTVDDVGLVRHALEGWGGSDLDLAWAGICRPTDRARIELMHGAGATWWIEVLAGSHDDVMARVEAGPAR